MKKNGKQRRNDFERAVVVRWQFEGKTNKHG